MKVQHPQGRIRLIAGVVVAASLASSYTMTQQVGRAPLECPGYSDTVSHVPLSGPIGTIPEFHDCQRFLDSTGDNYDSRYAIFAALRLDSLLADLSRARDSIAGPPGDEEEDEGHDHSRAAAGKVERSGASFRTVPVATIYTPDGTYPPLGVQPGFNCLFLYAHSLTPGAQPTRWGAKMVPWGADSNCLDHHIDPYPAAVGRALDVRPSPPDRRFHFTDADYPAVARWDWDPKHKRQYLGIKCGAAWCEVGDRRFKSSGPYSGPVPNFDPVPGITVTPAMKARVTAIKGWYDAQVLAMGGGTRPSRVYGVVIPNPALDALSSLPSSVGAEPPGLKFYTDRWVDAASAVLDRNYGKWNFTKGENRIWLCYGTATSCKVPLAQPFVPPSTTPLTSCEYPKGNRAWWAKIVSRAGTQYVCVLRTDHSAQLFEWMKNNPGYIVKLPGAARWRWLSTDDGDWISCPSGCCTFFQ
jgi:hypothetical protein